MGSGVVYREITVKSALTRVQGMPFAWSLNPYYGCERACVYCYAREYHAKRDRDTGAGFDHEIDVKINFPERLADELRRLRRHDETVALGTATDPYQQCEGRYRITRRTLEVLVASPLPLVIVTKGSMVVRDIDLLARLDVRVCMSIGTVSDEIARTSEPHASPPRARLEAVRRLVSAGIDAGVLAAPILPGLSDSEESLDAVAAAAEKSGATFFSTRPLKLDPHVKPHYFEFLAQRFPALLPMAEERFADRVNPERAYTSVLEERARRVRSRYRFVERPYRSEPARPAQLKLAI
ncbi:MAG TPA: radical SAM protein [Candidatus Limnocylindria bacterium]|nr:radical SAM protein [Candidatus Limnocylindria bacterium]